MSSSSANVDTEDANYKSIFEDKRVIYIRNILELNKSVTSEELFQVFSNPDTIAIFQRFLDTDEIPVLYFPGGENSLTIVYDPPAVITEPTLYIYKAIDGVVKESPEHHIKFGVITENFINDAYELINQVVIESFERRDTIQDWPDIAHWDCLQQLHQLRSNFGIVGLSLYGKMNLPTPSDLIHSEETISMIYYLKLNESPKALRFKSILETIADLIDQTNEAVKLLYAFKPAITKFESADDWPTMKNDINTIFTVIKILWDESVFYAEPDNFSVLLMNTADTIMKSISYKLNSTEILKKSERIEAINSINNAKYICNTFDRLYHSSCEDIIEKQASQSKSTTWSFAYSQIFQRWICFKDKLDAIKNIIQNLIEYDRFLELTSILPMTYIMQNDITLLIESYNKLLVPLMEGGDPLEHSNNKFIVNYQQYQKLVEDKDLFMSVIFQQMYNQITDFEDKAKYCQVLKEIEFLNIYSEKILKLAAPLPNWLMYTMRSGEQRTLQNFVSQNLWADKVEHVLEEIHEDFEDADTEAWNTFTASVDMRVLHRLYEIVKLNIQSLYSVMVDRFTHQTVVTVNLKPLDSEIKCEPSLDISEPTGLYNELFTLIDDIIYQSGILKRIIEEDNPGSYQQVIEECKELIPLKTK
ncbi:hypothetical protein GJ496_000719 [Pomphorhynchus laevis]|nr:hypothetical protein GJ496_000719 [Pomphorhynchus laevis]